MAFKAKEPEPKPGRDCKDFKPMFFNRKYCKLTDKCDNTYEYIVYGRFGGYCSGVHNAMYRVKIIRTKEEAKSNDKKRGTKECD